QSTARWLEAIAANPDFRFTAKLYQTFTHSRDASSTDEQKFKEAMEPLAAGGRLGALLAQFPISFKYTPANLDYAVRLRARFRDGPLVMEVRHRSWNDAAVFEVLAEAEIGLCNIDQPLIGRALKPAAAATARIGYVRLHGRNYKNWFAENSSVADRYDYLY